MSYNPKYNYASVYGQTSLADRSSLIQKVMLFTSFSIVATIVGVFAGVNGLHSAYNMTGGGTILWIIGYFVLLIAAFALRGVAVVNFVVLYAFTFVTGIILAPTMQILADNGYSGIIYQALGITVAITIGLGLYAYTTKRDFSGFAPYLFVAVLGLVAVSILNIFLRNSLLYSVISYAGLCIFCFYLVFDVQSAKKSENTTSNAIALSINVYLDILNIFLYLIRILASFRD